jgi:hypothetical protein
VTWGSRGRAARSGGSRRMRPPLGCLLWVIALIVVFVVLSLLFGDLQKGAKPTGAPQSAAHAGCSWRPVSCGRGSPSPRAANRG